MQQAMEKCCARRPNGRRGGEQLYWQQTCLNIGHRLPAEKGNDSSWLVVRSPGSPDTESYRRTSTPSRILAPAGYARGAFSDPNMSSELCGNPAQGQQFASVTSCKEMAACSSPTCWCSSPVKASRGLCAPPVDATPPSSSSTWACRAWGSRRRRASSASPDSGEVSTPTDEKAKGESTRHGSSTKKAAFWKGDASCSIDQYGGASACSFGQFAPVSLCVWRCMFAAYCVRRRRQLGGPPAPLCRMRK